MRIAGGVLPDTLECQMHELENVQVFGRRYRAASNSTYSDNERGARCAILAQTHSNSLRAIVRLALEICNGSEREFCHTLLQRTAGLN